jgi:hypothetical protein
MSKNLKLLRYLAVFIVFALFLVPRFLYLKNNLGFDWDQEKYSFDIMNIVRNHKFTLLGPRANNDRGFFLGPHFTYLLAPFYILTNLHPSGAVLFLIIYNLIFFTFGFLTIRNLFSFKHSLLLFFAWAVNFYFFTYDVGAWWPVLIPLGVILVWRLLFIIKTKNEFKHWVFLGAALGFFFNIHFQFIFIVFFTTVFLLLDNKIKAKSINKLAALLASFAALFSPLILFDLRHGFLNIRLLIDFFTKNRDGLPNPLSFIPVFQNATHSYYYIDNDAVGVGFYFLILFFLIFLSRSKKEFGKVFYRSALLLWLSFPLAFFLYGKRPSEYYFNFLHPFILITVIDFFISIKKEILLYMILIPYLWFSSSEIVSRLKPTDINLNYKDKAVYRLSQIVKGRECNISFNIPLGRDTGFRYFIEYYGIKQSGDWDNDPLVEIRIPPGRNDVVIGGIGLKIPKELK